MPPVSGGDSGSRPATHASIRSPSPTRCDGATARRVGWERGGVRVVFHPSFPRSVAAEPLCGPVVLEMRR